MPSPHAAHGVYGGDACGKVSRGEAIEGGVEEASTLRVRGDLGQPEQRPTFAYGQLGIRESPRCLGVEAVGVLRLSGVEGQIA